MTRQTRKSLIAVGCITAAILFSVFLVASSPAFAQGLISVDTLEVVDGNGVRVGRVQDLGPHVIFDFDGQLVRIQVNSDELVGDTQLFFESIDCTGTRWIVDFPSSIKNAAIEPPNGTIYSVDIFAIPQIIPASSSLFRGACMDIRRIEIDPDCPVGKCEIRIPVSIEVVPAVALSDLSASFTPPFTVQAEDTSKGPKK